jgi:hypothetical protein
MKTGEWIKHDGSDKCPIDGNALCKVKNIYDKEYDYYGDASLFVWEKVKEYMIKPHSIDDATSGEWDNVTNKITKANEILKQAEAMLTDRANDRDVDEERSMSKIVKVFNEIYGKDLTTEQGWQFMTILKMVRSSVGQKADDYIDGACYFALAGEEVSKK